jgi:hypothetical protein
MAVTVVAVAITAFMITHRTQLSRSCRRVMDRDRAARPGKLAMAQ